MKPEARSLNRFERIERSDGKNARREPVASSSWGMRAPRRLLNLWSIEYSRGQTHVQTGWKSGAGERGIWLGVAQMRSSYGYMNYLYVVQVFVRNPLRICMSSSMRWRNGETAELCAFMAVVLS